MQADINTLMCSHITLQSMKLKCGNPCTRKCISRFRKTICHNNSLAKSWWTVALTTTHCYHDIYTQLPCDYTILGNKSYI